MDRRIYIGIMALPIYLYNAGVNIVISDDAPSCTNQLLATTALMSDDTNTNSQIIPGQISTRDEQTEDCLRRRTCKD
ncbi:hypothetical protein Nos7524_2846 [Nostoc sp. PCC 7524]|uniref:hypothetical protein n=1 Tax=Nostoc sp. (strain ATCC 29411 / PCC 7524) TaxID=28072 RepID=UPI00029EC49C|nr:hypothetical protein [Nostoc sp. PCC 7524]AFY48664.1 hypothetical protein Nos7524_2846 [Nostoc sp. PCC 7524]